MKSFVLLLLSLMIVSLSSCEYDEITINNSDIDYSVVISSGENNKLIKIELPDGNILSEDLLADNNIEPLSGIPSKLLRFMDKLYVLIPENYSIEVFNDQTFERLAVYDFSADKLEPTDISFPNATDAYVLHGNDSLISLIDMTNYSIARQIETKSNPVSAAYVGNQMFVACRGSNYATVIDTRTHKQEAEVYVSYAPIFAGVSPDRGKIVILSAGAGKYDDQDKKTECELALINPINHELIGKSDLSITRYNSIEMRPISAAVADNNYCYFSTDEYLIKIYTLSVSSPIPVKQGKFDLVYYAKHRNRLLLFENESMNLLLFNPANNGIEKKILMPTTINSVITL